MCPTSVCSLRKELKRFLLLITSYRCFPFTYSFFFFALRVNLRQLLSESIVLNWVRKRPELWKKEISYSFLEVCFVFLFPRDAQ